MIMEILKKEVQEKDRAIGNQRAKPIYDVKRPVDLQGRQLPIPLQSCDLLSKCIFDLLTTPPCLDIAPA